MARKRGETRRMKDGMKTKPWGKSNDVKMRRNRDTMREIQEFEHVGLNLKKRRRWSEMENERRWVDGSYWSTDETPGFNLSK